MFKKNYNVLQCRNSNTRNNLAKLKLAFTSCVQFSRSHGCSPPEEIPIAQDSRIVSPAFPFKLNGSVEVLEPAFGFQDINLVKLGFDNKYLAVPTQLSPSENTFILLGALV